MAYRRRYRMTVPRRRYRSRFGRYTRSFRRNMLSTLQQRDAGRFTVKLRKDFIVQVAAGENYGWQSASIWDVLATDPQFTALRTLYDQVKINGARIQAVCNVQPESTSQYLPSYVYAWDRNGIELNGSRQDVYNKIATYGSSLLRPISNGTHNTFRTSIVAQDLQERTMYIGTNNMNSVTDSSSLAELFFKPVFVMGVYQPVTVGQANQYLWQVEYSVDISFRGTKYSSLAQ